MTIAARQHQRDLMFAYLPPQMTAARRWLVHLRKRPFYPDGTPRRGQLDGADDLSRLGSFDDAINRWNAGTFDGVGFALGPDEAGGHFQGIDIDRADLADFASTLPGYVERSPSGVGFHAIGYGRHFPTLGPNGSGVEAYAAGRYFTVTGDHVSGGALTCLADAVEGRLRPLHGPAAVVPPPVPTPALAAVVATDQTVADLRSALTALSADGYDLWYKMGLALKCLDNAGLDLWLEWSSKSAKFDHRQALAKWAGFEPTSTGFRAVFAEAQRAGWQNPNRSAFADVPTLPAIQARTFMVNGVPMAELPIASGFGPALPAATPGLSFPVATRQEWYSAQPSPKEIVANHFYADVGVFIAPGGTGKTTLILWQAVHIALGRDLWGMAVIAPAPVLILTAEDSRELLIARLRSICKELRLTEEETQLVAERVRIGDVSGLGFRLTVVERDVVAPAEASLAELINAAKVIGPALIVVDPAVSFGVGEARVNDAEQGLITAARRVVREVGCCVLYVHHTGKQNARDKTLDSYSGRGGSAFADGARLVHVLQSLTPADWLSETGEELGPDDTGLVLARPKGSYTALQPHIYIRRRGYRFDAVAAKSRDRSELRQVVDDKVWRLLNDELTAGRFHSANSLDALESGLKRADLRNALARLSASGRVQERDRPDASARGARRYLHPVATD